MLAVVQEGILTSGSKLEGPLRKELLSGNRIGTRQLVATEVAQQITEARTLYNTVRLCAV
jgi:hypothetical protein